MFRYGVVLVTFNLKNLWPKGPRVWGNRLRSGHSPGCAYFGYPPVLPERVSPGALDGCGTSGRCCLHGYVVSQNGTGMSGLLGESQTKLVLVKPC